MLFSKANINKEYQIGKVKYTITPGINELPSALIKDLMKIPMFKRNVDKGLFTTKEETPEEPKKKKKDK